jgi:hypothetical protein
MQWFVKTFFCGNEYAYNRRAEDRIFLSVHDKAIKRVPSSMETLRRVPVTGDHNQAMST